MGDTKKVAVISFHTCPLAVPGIGEAGGMNVYIREVSRELSKRGFTIDIFTRWKEPSASRIVNYDGVRVVHVEAGPKGPSDKNDLHKYLPRFLDELKDFVQGNQYHILHSHYWLSGWVGGKLKKAWNIPLIHMFHTLGRLKEEREPRLEVEQETIAVAESIIASNPAERDHLIEHYQADPEKIEVIPCGVDLGLFRPMDKAESRRRLGLPEGRYLLFVGRIDPVKGIDTLLSAMALLFRRHPETRLLIVGDGSPDQERDRLTERCKVLGLDGSVKFLGSKPQNLLPYLYSLAQACILPSRYESFGLVGLEAMACGAPVIASNVGGLSFLVEHEENGLLFPAGDERELAEKIELVLEDDGLRQKLGGQGRERAQGFSWKTVARSISALYQRYVG